MTTQPKREPLKAYLQTKWRGLTPLQRLETRIDRSGECWVWRGQIVPGGYGGLFWQGRMQRAHRVVYEFENAPIPKGLFACHKCDNRLCVRPSHIFLGTNQDNMRDASAKGRLGGPILSARKEVCKRGHKFTKANSIIGRLGKQCRTCKSLSEKAYRARGERSRAARLVRSGRKTGGGR